MKRVIAVLIYLLWIPALQASTHTVSTCTATNIQNAFTAATEDGAVVFLDCATGSLTGGASWTAPSNAILQGRGSTSIVGGNDLTVLTDNYASGSAIITITANSSGTFRMYGITFQGGSGDVKADGMVAIGGQSANVRVDHNNFKGSTYSPFVQSSLLEYTNCTYGVTDHNIFDGASVQNNIRDYNAGSCFSDSFGQGDQSWAHTTSLGSSSFMFAEDNVFGAGAGNDCLSGGRYVFRFNVFNSKTPAPTLQTHPTGGSARHRGCRAWEIYDNQFIAVSTFYINDAVWISSGTGVIFGNSAPSSSDGGGTGYQNFLSLHEMRYDDSTYTQDATPDGWGYCSNHQNGSGSLWDQSATTGHLCIDAPGAGVGDLLVNDFPNVLNNRTGTIAWPAQVQEPIYVWLNAYSNVPNNPSTYIAGGSTQTFSETVDWYQGTGSTSVTAGIGSGARSSRPSTCVTGVAYWSTDQGSWNGGSNSFYTGQGVLDKCTSTNTWTNDVYHPYAYPHPLVDQPVALTNSGSRFHR